jgi:hypothetical protein
MPAGQGTTLHPDAVIESASPSTLASSLRADPVLPHGPITRNEPPDNLGAGAPAMTVLIGFADALAAIEAFWALRDDGWAVVAFARRDSRPALSRCQGVRIVEITAPEEDAAAARSDLAGLLASLCPAAVLPLCDQSVWLCDQVHSSRRGHEDHLRTPLRGRNGANDVFRVAGPTGEQARTALDKLRQLELAERAGFAVPPWTRIDAGQLTNDDPSSPGTGKPPWFVKPALAVEEREDRLVRPSGRVASDIDAARAIAADFAGPAIAQPVITGTGEGVFGLATEGGVVGWCAHRRVRMMNPRGSGSSACRSIPVAPDVREAAERFVELAGWRGVFMIELLRNDTGPYFMELNGRSWGSMALSCRRGYAFPAWAVQSRLDPTFRPTVPVNARHLTCRHLGGELVHLAFVLRGARDKDSRVWPSRREAVRDVLTFRHGEAWYNWRRDEPAVLAADTWQAVRGQFLRWTSG